MRKNAMTRLYASVLFALGALAGTATSASAQFEPRTVDEPVVGEKYFIEGSSGFWSPGTSMSISSESLGIPGDIIDFRKDLGLTNHRFREMHLVLRPGKRHKLRYQYIPMQYDQSAVAAREITFNGQRFTAGIPVNSSLNWHAHRFGYEFDFISMARGYGGFVLDVKQTDVRAYLESPLVRRESAHAAAPIPAIGGIFRYYFIPQLSLTGEITGFTLPERIFKDVKGHYLDVDFYGTYNFTRYFGAQFGFRRFDLGYQVDDDFGDFELKGVYFGAVIRY